MEETVFFPFTVGEKIEVRWCQLKIYSILESSNSEKKLVKQLCILFIVSVKIYS